MKTENLPEPKTPVVSMYKIFESITRAFTNAPRAEYDLRAHAKFVRIRKAAYEASYWLEAGTREVSK